MRMIFSVIEISTVLEEITVLVENRSRGRVYIFLEHTFLNVIVLVEKYDPLFVRNTLCRVEYNRIGRIFTCFAQYFN